MVHDHTGNLSERRYRELYGNCDTTEYVVALSQVADKYNQQGAPHLVGVYEEPTGLSEELRHIEMCESKATVTNSTACFAAKAPCYWHKVAGCTLSWKQAALTLDERVGRVVGGEPRPPCTSMQHMRGCVQRAQAGLRELVCTRELHYASGRR